MRAEADLLSALERFLQRLEVQREELQRLLAATEELQSAVRRGGDEDALQDGLKKHAGAFNDARTAEEQARLARHAVCELLGVERWSTEDVQRGIERLVLPGQREEAQRILARITAAADAAVGLLERLDALTPVLEAELRQRMAQVGGEVQRRRQGRAAVDAYSGPVGGFEARFIDKRE